MTFSLVLVRLFGGDGRDHDRDVGISRLCDLHRHDHLPETRRVVSVRITLLDLTRDGDNKTLDDLARPRQIGCHGRARNEISKTLTLVARFQQTDDVPWADSIILIDDKA